MFKSKKLDISKICRSCLIDTGDMKSLYDQYSTNMCVGEVLMTITTMSSLEFYDDIDELPKQICHKCITELNKSYTFILKCRESEEALRNYLNDVINRKKTNSIDANSRKLDIITNDFNSSSTDLGLDDNDELNIESNLLINNAFSVIDNDLYNNNVSTNLGAEKRSVLEKLLTNTTDYKYNEKKDMQTENTNHFRNEEMNTNLFLDHTYIQTESSIFNSVLDDSTPSELEKLLTAQLDNKHNEKKIIRKGKTNVTIENVTDEKFTKTSDSIVNEINLIETNQLKGITRKRKSNDFNKYTHNKLKDTTKQNLTKLVQNNENINFHNEFIKSILASDQIARKKIDGRLKPTETRSNHLKLEETDKIVLREDSCESNVKASTETVTQHYNKTNLCPFCGSVYKRNSDLKSHMRKHTGEKPYKCSYCSKTFSNGSNLPRHERTHTGERPYSCTVCGRPFIDKPTLVCHMRSHTREKPYSCKMCNKPFSRTSQLIRHMRSHTGEKPHSCTVCSASFVENSTLKVHMRIHTGERPYSCTVCGIAIISKNKLSIHMRRHTGEKPYSCTICHTPFTQTSSLKLHLRNKHNIYIPPSVHFVSNRKTLHD